MPLYDKYQKMERVYICDNNIIHMNPPEYVKGDLIERTEYTSEENCLNGIKPVREYQWIIIPFDSSNTNTYQCENNNLYSVEKEQYSDDSGNTWYDVQPLNIRRGDILYEDYYLCGGTQYPIIYQWRETTFDSSNTDTYLCENDDLYSVKIYKYSTDNGMSWFNVEPLQKQKYKLLEENSELCGYEPEPEIIYQWVDIEYNSGNPETYICENNNLYKKQKEQYSEDNGKTWRDTSPLNTRKGDLIEENSDLCIEPVEPIYQWNQLDFDSADPRTYACLNYDLHFIEVYQVSYDSGNTWEDVYPEQRQAGDLIEANSNLCGYLPPTPTGSSSVSFTSPQISSINFIMQRFNASTNLSTSDRTEVTLENNGTYNLTDLDWYENISNNSYVMLYYNNRNGGNLDSEIHLDVTLDEQFNNTQRMFYNFSRNQGGNSYNPYSVTFTTNNSSKSTNMKYMFAGNLRSLDLTNFDTSEVTDMSYAFYSEISEFIGANLNVEKATTMANAFAYCDNLTELDLSGWNPISLTNTSYMFYQCENLTTLNISSWIPTSNLTSFNGMFNGCTKLANITTNATMQKWLQDNYVQLGLNNINSINWTIV